MSAHASPELKEQPAPPSSLVRHRTAALIVGVVLLAAAYFLGQWWYDMQYPAPGSDRRFQQRGAPGDSLLEESQ